MHVASPYVIDVEDPQRDLVDPAVIGTTNVLRAADAAGVKRVILTSSAAAITDEPEDRVYTEADWNVKSSLTRNPTTTARHWRSGPHGISLRANPHRSISS